MIINMFELAGLGLGIEELLGLSLIGDVIAPEVTIPLTILMGGLAVFNKVKSNHERKEREK